MWPKTIFVRGIAVQINSWEDFDDVIERYGTDATPHQPPDDSGDKLQHPSRSRFPPRDLALLRYFVDNSSVATTQIGQALGKQGKGIKSGLDEWARKIGLSDNSNSPFEPCFRKDGRGYRLSAHFKDVAKLMLEQK